MGQWRGEGDRMESEGGEWRWGRGACRVAAGVTGGVFEGVGAGSMGAGSHNHSFTTPGSARMHPPVFLI